MPPDTNPEFKYVLEGTSHIWENISYRQYEGIWDNKSVQWFLQYSSFRVAAKSYSGNKSGKDGGQWSRDGQIFTPVIISLSLQANNCNDLVPLAHHSTSTEDLKLKRWKIEYP